MAELPLLVLVVILGAGLGGMYYLGRRDEYRRWKTFLRGRGVEIDGGWDHVSVSIVIDDRDREVIRGGKEWRVR